MKNDRSPRVTHPGAHRVIAAELVASIVEEAIHVLLRSWGLVALDTQHLAASVVASMETQGIGALVGALERAERLGRGDIAAFAAAMRVPPVRKYAGLIKGATFHVGRGDAEITLCGLDARGWTIEVATAEDHASPTLCFRCRGVWGDLQPL